MWLQVESNEDVVEASAQGSRHEFGPDGVEQLILTHVLAQGVSCTEVRLETQRGVQRQSVRVETENLSYWLDIYIW